MKELKFSQLEGFSGGHMRLMTSIPKRKKINVAKATQSLSLTFYIHSTGDNPGLNPS